MPEPRAISGALRIGIRVAPNGEPCVLLEQLDGSGFLLPKGQALHYAFTILATARNLFSSIEELEQALLDAKAEVDRIAPVTPNDARGPSNPMWKN